MAKTVADVMNMVKESEVKFVDFRFTDTRGKEQHVTVPISRFDEDKFTGGHAFDGSSIAGWKGIEASDMQLMPDPNTANIDPFFEEPTLILTCDVRRARRRQALRARPALARQARRGVHEGLRPRRRRLLRPRARVLHLRQRALAGRHVGLLLQDRVGGSVVELGARSTSTATRAIGRRSRAATSRRRRSTRCRTCAPRCA